MSLGKKDISNNISSKAQISYLEASKLADSFIKLVKKNSQNNIVKFTSFGTFYIHKSPERKGRNPKTMEEFKIKSRSKLSFKSSNKIKKILN